MVRFIGIDLHKTAFTVCFLEGEEKRLESYKIGEMDRFRSELRRDDKLALETTTNTRSFIKQIRDAVGSIHVINTMQFKVVSQSVKKTDANDAETMAFFLSKGMLPEVRMKDEHYAELESLANTRHKLVQLRTALKNKIHNILNAQGIVTKKESLSSRKGLEKVLNHPISAVAAIELEVIVEQIKGLDAGIARIDQELADKGKKLDGHENITSIKGVGDKGGAILLSVIGNIEDFEDEKKLAAYFGIVPRISNSNETNRQGRITKRGSKLGRTTLVQCTLIAIRYSPYLKAFYEKLKAKKGSGKAIIATAKKLLGIIYLTLKNKWVFEDFPNFVLKES
jgi:transposase